MCDKYESYQPILGNEFCEREGKGEELALCKAQKLYKCVKGVLISSSFVNSLVVYLVVY